MRSVLKVMQVGPDADRAQIADDRLDLVALAVTVKVDVEAVRIAGLRKQLLGFRRIIGIARRGLVAAAELRREARHVEHARTLADDGLDHRLTVDCMHDRLAHAQITQLRRKRALGRIHLQERIAHDFGR